MSNNHQQLYVSFSFFFLYFSSFLYFGSGFNKTIMPLAFIEYENIITTLAPR